jgi:hypothetical protein
MEPRAGPRATVELPAIAAAIPDPDGEWHWFQSAKPGSGSGQANGNAALSDGDAAKVRRLHEEGLSRRELAQAFEVSLSTIGKILSGRTYRTAPPLVDD